MASNTLATPILSGRIVDEFAPNVPVGDPDEEVPKVPACRSDGMTQMNELQEPGVIFRNMECVYFCIHCGSGAIDSPWKGCVHHL